MTLEKILVSFSEFLNAWSKIVAETLPPRYSYITYLSNRFLPKYFIQETVNVSSIIHTSVSRGIDLRMYLRRSVLRPRDKETLLELQLHDSEICDVI